MKPSIETADYRLFGIIAILAITFGCDLWDKSDTSDEKIPVVTTEAVTDITNTSAVCKGNVISCGGSYWVNRGIIWSNIIQEPTNKDEGRWSDAGSHTGIFLTMLDYLTPGTTYYMRTYASNDAGVGYGSIIKFSTSGSALGEINFNKDLQYGTISDINGNSYKTIIIGPQTWMAENLRATRYNDGTDIPKVTDLAKWVNLTTPGYCWYLNEESGYKNIYGGLYNWHAVNTGKLCPAGWHVPADEEWEALVSYLGGEDVAGGKLKESGNSHWIPTNAGITATNASGFTALPGGTHWGVKTDPLSYYSQLGYLGEYWSRSECNDPGFGFYGAYTRSVSFASESCDRGAYTRPQGLSVRCIRDN